MDETNNEKGMRMISAVQIAAIIALIALAIVIGIFVFHM